MPVAQLAEMLRRSGNNLPTSNDGLTDAEAAANVENRQDKEALLMRAVKSFSGQVRRGNPLPPSALPSILDAIRHARIEGLDDRKLILEHVLALMSRLPPAPAPNTRQWSLQNEIQNFVIALFYDALPHPPTTFAPSKMLEVKVPTVVGDARLGAGGNVGLSDMHIGRANVPSHGPACSAGQPPSATATSATPSAATQPTLTNGSANGWTDALKGPQGPIVPQKAYNSAFRTPSGAGNNPHLPLLGAAGTAYARNVVPLHPTPLSALPDPGMVFEMLMRRRAPPPDIAATIAGKANGNRVDAETAAHFKAQGHGQPHPSGLSSLLFAFGDLIIHSLFRTGRGENDGINLTSSYLDLSVLYGVDEMEMSGEWKDGKPNEDKAARGGVRRHDGTGRLWEDTWADPRITMMGPAVGALLVVFCRNHNYVALRLLEINERKGYTQPAIKPPKVNSIGADKLFPGFAADKLAVQDDDLFNRARLINCAYFMNAILGDYLAGILGTFRDANDWYLNPLEEIRQGGVTKVQRAQGNQVSVEFNLLYRWHSTINPKDEDWLIQAFRTHLPDDARIAAMNKDNFELTKEDFVKAVHHAAADQGNKPIAWTFAGLKRTANGPFADHDLARILHGATDQVACAYGARGIPAVMKPVEIMGIEQARKWGVCTMNEFRQFVGLKKYDSFKEWNPTPGIAEAAEQLYHHIDNLELYVGLMCEESKLPGPGAGLCPGYTISRAILADAVCLTRGDRFFTTDLTPTNLTSWGYQDCARDGKNGSMGGNVSKLLFRTLPDYYPNGSVYAHFPFITPNEMKIWLTKMELDEQYSFEPLPSNPVRPVASVNTAKGVKQVLTDATTFKTTYTKALTFLTRGRGFFIGFDDEPRHQQARTMMYKAIYRDGAKERYAEFYKATTRKLIERHSFASGPNRRAVNIAHDVLNIVPVHWVCEEITGIPLKSEDAPRGIFTEQQVYGMLATMFTFIFLNLQPENEWPLTENAGKFSDTLIEFVKHRVQRYSGGGSMFSLKGVWDGFIHWRTQEVDNSEDFYRALIANNTLHYNNDELAYTILGMVTGSVANFGMAASLVVDFYLSDGMEKEKQEIMLLAKDNTPAAAARLTGYAREALRLHPQAPGIFRQAAADATIVEDDKLPSVHVKKGDRIFVSLANANKDPKVFKNPNVVDPTRPKEQYSSFGHGEHVCLGEVFVDIMIPAVMRSVFSLKGLKRGPGSTGVIAKFKSDIHGTETDLYISNKGTVSPFPGSLLVEYDA
ncbi:hypothetical protein M408DRAFT_333328 [Serendipita vermifera MAFF 305830]|uniref:linoleate 8R-lipoxygenase n=1 Tax=Serendipita vermifera MAFF 305830 TaxID=933852 RepID=A0A0C3ANR0_SERVB|nr:hypothetical protein M408DRAFT_333328 [Serendipita vermifera MAFF 305830]